MSDKTEVTVARVGTKVVLALDDGKRRMGVTMEPRDARHLLSRIGKAANDAASAAARARR